MFVCSSWDHDPTGCSDWMSQPPTSLAQNLPCKCWQKRFLCKLLMATWRRVKIHEPLLPAAPSMGHLVQSTCNNLLSTCGDDRKDRNMYRHENRTIVNNIFCTSIKLNWFYLQNEERSNSFLYQDPWQHQSWSDGTSIRCAAKRHRGTISSILILFCLLEEKCCQDC